MLRVLLGIPSLEPGGAERQLVALANGLHERGHSVAVAILGQGGPLENALKGPALHPLGKLTRLDSPRTLLRLAKLYRSFSPQCFYGFLPMPNLYGALLRTVFRKVQVVFGVRAGATDFGLYDYGLAGRASLWLEALASRLAQAVVVNSKVGLSACHERGIPPHLCNVIHNGIDTDTFRPDHAEGLSMRAVWNVPRQEMLIGVPARLDPVKDHATFFRAAQMLVEEMPDLRFACIGGGSQDEEARLLSLAEELGIRRRFIFAGAVADMTSVYNTLDIACLPSLSEGFPNVLAEAMACGKPCVATDVGETSTILGDTGVVVQVRDPEALAAGLREMLGRVRDQRQRALLGSACRNRIVSNFSMSRMVQLTEELLLRLV